MYNGSTTSGSMTSFFTATAGYSSDLITYLGNQSGGTVPENYTYFDVTTVGMTNNLSDITPSGLNIRSAAIIDILKLYIAPLLLILGTLGNVLSYVVFSRPALKKSATAFYFRTLAVADTLALNFGLWPNWMRDCFGIYIYPMTDAACQIQTYLRYVLSDCSAWVLVLMTIERAAGIQWPLQVHRIYTRLRTRVSVLVLVLLIGTINIPSIWINAKNVDVSHFPCAVANTVLGYDIWPWVDLLMYCLLPSVIMITCSAMIIRVLYRRHYVLSWKGDIYRNRASNITSMTLSLLTVTFAFLILSAPFAFYALTVSSHHASSKVDFILLYFIASFLRYVNNSVNFLLYCISGKTFRRELIQLWWHKKNKTTSSISRTDVTTDDVRRDSISSNRESMVTKNVESQCL